MFCSRQIVQQTNVFRSSLTRSLLLSLFHQAPSLVSGALHRQTAHCRGQIQTPSRLASCIELLCLVFICI